MAIVRPRVICMAMAIVAIPVAPPPDQKYVYKNVKGQGVGRK